MKVFISHSFDDAVLANDLEQILHKEKIFAYMAQQKPEYDLSVGDKIRREINDSDHMVAFITEKGFPSPSVNQELGFAQGIGIQPIVMIDRGVPKLGALTSEFEREEFDRENPLKSYLRVKNFIIKKGPRKRNSNQDHVWLLQNVYRPLYNGIIDLQKDSFFIKEKILDPWDKIENFAKLKIDKNIKEKFETLSSEIRNWNSMSRELEREFSYKRKKLGDIFKKCFAESGLLDSHEMIRLTPNSWQEPLHWVEAFKEILLFDTEIKDGQELYQKLYAHSLLRDDDHNMIIKKFRQRATGLFDCLFEKIPEARKFYESEMIDTSLLQQKNTIKSLATQLQMMLESKLS